MKKYFLFVLFAAVALTVCGKEAKYVFLFIGDGMATPQRMIAEEFSRKAGHGKLALNTLHFHATTRTCSANSLVTDSAASATAIACGAKTNNGMVGVDPEGNRLQSVAEFARDRGRKVGIITSVTLNHATPAGFYGHRRSRSEGYALGLDLIASNFDFFGGGGLSRYKEREPDIYTLAKKAGYTVTVGKKELDALKPGEKAIALADKLDKAMPYAIDGQENMPTLDEITAKAVSLLDNPKGFFIMVEGGAIDWAGHSNDAATNLREVLAFDKAVKVALAFYEKHPDETLIITTGDHETGGMTMGFAGSGYAMFMERLVNQKCSVPKFADLVTQAKKDKPDLTFEGIKPLLTEKFGFRFIPAGRKFLTEGEVNYVRSVLKKTPQITLDELKKRMTERQGVVFGDKARISDAELQFLVDAVKADGQQVLVDAVKADGKRSAADLLKQMHEKFGFEILADEPMRITEKEEQTLAEAFKENKLAGAARIILSGKAGIGWTSGSHTALPTLTTASGVHAELFTGFIDNSDIALKLKTIL